jgi:pimeloyl-ACP methyl ester carboxylesterase
MYGNMAGFVVSTRESLGFRQLRTVVILITAVVMVSLAGCANTSWKKEAAPTAAPCPTGTPDGARCLRGQDSAGAHYLIVMPKVWSGVLVVHAHGGPVLGDPKASRADEDIQRWAITVQEGHAWAASVFRQGGFAVTTAAEDTERVRRIFLDHVATPRRTILHGQSWGAMVATRAAEMYPKSWEGILLTSGVVAGPATYDFRLDLRAVYQHLCNNHPRPDEPQYPLSIGLPANAKMTAADLAARANECLGLRQPAAQRSPEQMRKIKTIVDVIRIPENSIIGHLNWGTFTLQDVVRRTGGVSPFHNASVRYQGSSDDAALNSAVLRFPSHAPAIAAFAADTDHAGRRHSSIPVNTVTWVIRFTRLFSRRCCGGLNMARGRHLRVLLIVVALCARRKPTVAAFCRTTNPRPWPRECQCVDRRFP